MGDTRPGYLEGWVGLVHHSVALAGVIFKYYAVSLPPPCCPAPFCLIFNPLGVGGEGRVGQSKGSVPSNPPRSFVLCSDLRGGGLARSFFLPLLSWDFETSWMH